MRRILWFRRDLRVTDQPLLALEGEVLPIFIFDPLILDALDADDRRLPLLQAQVAKLKSDLLSLGLDLKIFHAPPLEVFKSLLTLGFDEVAASGDYDSYARERDRAVSHLLPFHFIDDTYIFSPTEVLKKDGAPYLVFTPFYNQAKKTFGAHHIRCCQKAKQKLISYDYGEVRSYDEALLFDKAQALKRLKTRLKTYPTDKEFPSIEGTSHLGFALRFGLLSIRELLRFLAAEKKAGTDTEPFFRQLIFRDFYAALLYHFPHIQTENYKYAFKGIPDQEKMKAFCTAQTGVPIVDAGVTELLQTGFMHNRVRMICASFFTKDLLLPWQWGEAFFARHLLDYDCASNVLSWQWSSGTGIDPQPYFRIFNPYLQAKKFDPDGRYIKAFLSCLKSVNPKELHDEDFLCKESLPDYPKPIVIHKEAKQKAVDLFKTTLT